MKQVSFIAACKDYFGLRAGQTTQEFMNEIRALDDADRAYFKALFPSIGYEIV